MLNTELKINLVIRLKINLVIRSYRKKMYLIDLAKLG